MKHALLAAVALTALSGPVLAADLPVKPAKAVTAPVVVAPNWTGGYIGLGLGGRFMDSDWTTTQAFDPNGAPIGFATSPTASFSDGAFRVSGYAGYNWQLNPTWLAGLEADIGWAKNNDREASRIPGLGVLNAGSFAEVSGTWDASVRARIGALLTPTTLAYATGGVAFQHIEAGATCPADTFVCNPALGRQSFSSSKTLTGWTLGAGLESMIARNWLARVEYRYTDLGDFSFVAIPPQSGSSFGANAKVSTTSHTVTLGLAWKL